MTANQSQGRGGVCWPPCPLDQGTFGAPDTAISRGRSEVISVVQEKQEQGNVVVMRDAEMGEIFQHGKHSSTERGEGIP